ncbi:MAG: MATE family efflux transporter [Lachnospiraceae bacterium]|nr:MATE family efflux transporter [Lachnospiraceae bacterium]
MIKDRNFYKSFFAMFTVLVLQNVITLSVNLADNLMLGAYSETALSGAAAVNQIQFVYQMILLAFGEGVVVLGTQYFGKKDLDPIRKLSSIAMRFGSGAALLLFLLVTLFPEKAVAIFTTDAGIIAAGTEYLYLIRFSYFFFAVTQILLATLRSTGVVKIALGLSIQSLIINCCINFTLIYGHFGAPELGIKGAAIGTLTARILEMLTLFLFIRKKEKNLQLRFRSYKYFDRSLLGDYVRLMAPLLFVNSVWGFNNAAQNAILGHMTARAIAANSVASTLFLLVKSGAQGAAGTASFFIGRTIGEGNMDKLRSYAKTMQILFVFIGIAAGILLFLIRIPILGIYKLEPETLELANQFLLILCVVVVTMSYQMPTNSGIIKAGGATRYCMVLDLVSIWCICLPAAFLMAFVLHASPAAVIWMLNADQIFKCIPAFIKCNYCTWAYKLTRD